MRSTEELITWAREEAARIGGQDRHSDYAGMEFLRVHSGEKSEFYASAAIVGAGSVRPGRVMNALTSWADFTEAGLAAASPELSLRLEAATDLMEQVQSLLNDTKVHHAAPVMLAGAALEEALRGLVITNNLSPSGKPGISSYADALRSAEIISRQQRKDIESWGGLRNHAAHGEFGEFDRKAAQVMALAVNNFLAAVQPT